MTRPLTVEAVEFTDLRAAMEFLRPGEFSMVTKNSVTLVIGGTHCTAEIGMMLVRDEQGVWAEHKETFDETYFPDEGNGLMAGNFTASQMEDGSWWVECDKCGPVGSSQDADQLAAIGMSHLKEGCRG